MKMQEPDESLPVASERDETGRALHPRTVGVLADGPDENSRGFVKEASIFEMKQAHQPARTEFVAAPFLEYKVLLLNVGASAPSRGQDDVYKGKKEEGLFDGDGRVTVPIGLIERAGGKHKDEDDGESAEKGAEAKDVDDSDKDPLAENYLNAEDGDAWLEQEPGRYERPLARGDLRNIGDERRAQLMKTAEEQNAKEDDEWFNGLATLATKLANGSFHTSHPYNDLRPLIAMMRYQPSRRLAMREDTVMDAMHQEAPLICILEELCAKVLLDFRKTGGKRWWSEGQFNYQILKKHCKLILGPDNSFADQISTGAFDKTSGEDWPPFAKRTQMARHQIFDADSTRIPTEESISKNLSYGNDGAQYNEVVHTLAEAQSTYQ